MPAVIGKAERAHGGEQAGGAVDRNGTSLDGGDRVAEDQAEDRHEQQRHELDEGGGVLEIAAALAGERVEAEADEDPRRADQALKQDGAVDVEERAEIDADDPREHRDDRGIVDERLEPAVGAGHARTDELLIIGHDAAGLVCARGDLADGKAAEDDGERREGEHEDAERHAAVRRREDAGGLEEDAAADDRAGDQRDGGEQTIALLTGLLFVHMGIHSF